MPSLSGQKTCARFGPLGVTASVQPAHALDDRDAADANWAGRTDRAFPLRSLLTAGATLALGSDAPVAPLEPWTAMSAATTRAGGDGRAPWHPEQTLTRQEALAASTRGRGTDRVGDPADLVVLDGDPLAVSDAHVRRDAGGGHAGGGTVHAPRPALSTGRQLAALDPGLDEVGERQPAVLLDERGVVPGFGRGELLDGQLLPGDHQGSGTGKLPDQPAVPVARRLAFAEVDEFLDLPAQPAVAFAAGAGLAHVEDVGAVDPFGVERFRLQGGVLLLEDAGRALGQELRAGTLRAAAPRRSRVSAGSG